MYTIGQKYGTDKVTWHRYDRFYPKYIDFVKNIDNAAILEIGLDKGASLNMWLEYLPNAYIYGIDIGYSKEGERYTIFKGDQSKQNDLINIMKHINKNVYVINDDGSHIPEHQILTFNIYFKDLLEYGGTYIIEDIETSYWTKKGLYGYSTNYGYKHSKSFIEKCKLIFDYINREFLTADNINLCINELVEYGFNIDTLNLISSMTIAHNCIIFIKKNKEEIGIENREYKFKDWL